MYISLEWLKDYVEIPKAISPEELGRKLTLHTVEIDAVLAEEKKYDRVVVGEIKDVKPHPGADRLRLAEVDAGGEKNLHIVCGAPNIAIGQKVPVAMIGAILPGEVEIKAVKVRGEDSEGMLCAEDELGLGSDHDGIMILEKKAKIGQPFGQYLKLKDVIYELDNKSITNRPDLWSHLGLARDIAAFLPAKFKGYNPKFDWSKETEKGEETLKVEIEDPKKCLRYMAVKLEGIKVAESPEWLRARLIAVGVRPINNIVDITNYVMMDLGQPMHAFDASLIEADESGRQKIIVRQAKEGERFMTLDREERVLSKEDILIGDAKKPVAIAGVMGGENSEIKAETTSIIFESANFDHVSVRKTSARLGLRSEASKRFEKALDPNLCESALIRAIELTKKIIPGARLSSRLADEKKFSLLTGPIEVPFSWLDRVVGKKIDQGAAVGIFSRLGFSVVEKDDALSVTIPTWRATKDISSKEDLAEEIERIIGYDNIMPVMPLAPIKAPLRNRERYYERLIKQALSGSAKMLEVHNYSFVGEEQLEKLGIDYSGHLKLIKPIARQHTLCRRSLVPNLIDNVRANQARFEEFCLYEIGSVFSALDGSEQMDDSSGQKLPFQEKHIGLIQAGNDERLAYEDLKSKLGLLFSIFNIDFSFESTESVANWANQEFAASVQSDGRVIASIGLLSQAAARKAGLKKSAAIAEVNFSKFIDLCDQNSNGRFRESEKYPALVRDLAFVVNKKVAYGGLKASIAKFHELISSVELFDCFEGEKLGRDNKNLAFHIVYQAERTLTAKEVDEVQAALFAHLEERFGAKVRDF